MKRLTLLILTAVLALVLVAVPAAWAANGLECALAVYQFDKEKSEDVLLQCDTAEFVEGITATGFLVAFSVEIDVERVDSSRSEFIVHLVTLGPPTKNYSRSFVVEYGLPASITDIRGKGETRYSFVLTPLSMVDIDTSFCPFDHLAKGTFEFLPSAYMDIHYVPNSLGGFYVSVARDVLEEHYRQFRSLYNFSLPGKYSVYLCPCLLPSVIWDQRFGMAVDPTRSTAHAVFTKAFNAADPFMVLHTAVLRNYGYAPLFLSEGLANYLSFAILDMKEILQDGQAPALRDLLDTYRYVATDPYLADRVGATFVTFLIDEYGFARFRKLYRETDDLHLATDIVAAYGKNLGELEGSWRTYVDTVAIDPNRLGLFASMAEVMFNYPLMLRYCRILSDRATTGVDSVRALGMVKRACFFTGDYTGAIAAQEELLRLDGASVSGLMSLGTYKMMRGRYDESYDDLMRALSLDSTDRLVTFNLALNHMFRDNRAEASKLLRTLVDDSTMSGPVAESRVYLAGILRESDSEQDRQQTDRLYSDAVNFLNAALRGQPSSPAVHMWLGIAHLGRGETDRADNYLESALFLETRPFYQGMIHLWLGKAADLKGDRDKALEHYSQVLALAAADYHQNEARRYIKTPYEE